VEQLADSVDELVSAHLDRFFEGFWVHEIPLGTIDVQLDF